MSRVVKPKALQKNDSIKIISPASADEPEKFDEAEKTLTELGYEVSEGQYARERNGYFAGTDEQRASDFNEAVNSKQISAIFASRGGYGCSRLLPLIDYDSIAVNPKIILGGSDLTALLWAVHQKTKLITFFGPMALEMGKGLDDFSHENLWKPLSGRIAGNFQFPDNHIPYSLKRGIASGQLIGGCLSMVVSLLGTDYFGEVSGKILFLEEIGEKPFRIDRMLTHLRNAGVFDHISGILFGDFYNCWNDDDTESFTFEEVVHQILEDYDFPVLAGLPFGHAKSKMTLPLGIQVELDADKAMLTFLEEAVL